MRLLIDCYNLLHADMPPALAGLDERRLCGLLEGSAWDRGVGSVTVVADGGRKPGGPPPGGGAVRVCYSGPARTADDVLIELVEAASDPRRVTVVTSDREIRRVVKRRRARVLGSDDFVRRLAAHARRPLRERAGPRPSVPEPVPGQAEGWMRAMGFGPELLAELEAATAARVATGPVVRPRPAKPAAAPAVPPPDPEGPAWPRGPEDLGIAPEDWAMVADLFRR